MRGPGFCRVTPSGEGAVATIEVVGPGAADALARLFRPRGGRMPAAGEVRLGDLVDLDGEAIDEVVLAHVARGGGWSGLETWSLSIHGGLWLQKRVEEILGALGGSPLSPGEVLEMAVEQGSLDAIQAAAYALLVEARTDRAARFFTRQHAGELSASAAECLRLCERGAGAELRARLGGILVHAGLALRLARPARILLAGRPNAGKSTLFNRLVGEERTVVSPVPGTTRDLIEGEAALDDYPVVLVDSAGVRDPEGVGAVEREGIRRVVEGRFDGVVYLIPPPWGLEPEDETFLRSLSPDGRLIVGSMVDLEGGGKEGRGQPGRPRERPRDRSEGAARLHVSARTGEGIDGLRRAIVRAWIDGRDDPLEEVRCAPFTPRLLALFRRALAAVAGFAEGAAEDRPAGKLDAGVDGGVEGTPRAALDVARAALVESLRSSGHIELR